jgi:hypothetical protein
MTVWGFRPKSQSKRVVVSMMTGGMFAIFTLNHVNDVIPNTDINAIVLPRCETDSIAIVAKLAFLDFHFVLRIVLK